MKGINMEKGRPKSESISIIQKLIQSLSVSVLVFIILLVGFVVFLEHQHSQKALENSINNLTAYLAKSLALPLYVVDIKSVTAISEAIMQDKKVDGIAVHDEWNLVMQTSNIDLTEKSKRVQNDIVYKNEVIGRVEIFYRKAIFDQGLKWYLLGLFAVSLVVTLFTIFFIVFFLKRFLRKPMSELSEIALTYGKGDFQENKATQYVEFQGLEKVLSEMGARIAKQIQILSKTNKELKHQIREKEHAERVLRKELLANEVIADISKSLLVEKYDIKTVADKILNASRKLTGSQHGFVSSIDQNTWENIGHTLTEMFGDACTIKDQMTVFPRGTDGTYGGLWGHALNKQESFFTNTPQSHPSSKGLPGGHVPLNNYLAVPVVGQNRLLGLIALANSDSRYTEKDMSVVQRIGEMFSLAILRHEYETEKIKMQERIIQSQKMESIGNLAGGIAHDFNNILSPVVGYAEMIVEDFPEDSTTRKYASEILTAGKRGTGLVQQILSFSRQHEHLSTPVLLQSIIKEVLDLCRSIIPADIKIKQDIETNCGTISADATQIHQILMNLITNAYHAVMEAGGEITVSLREVTVDPHEQLTFLLKKGTYAMLTISDNGIGMSKEVQGKIFDPYFTTKEKGRGTGLGLAVTYAIIKEHQGEINVYSEPGKGTEFKIFLPIAHKTEKPVLDNTEPDIETGSERILLVDDDSSVLKMAKKMIERLGYTVVDSSDSVEALKIFANNPDNFDLVISDMTMPNLTGDKLALEVLRIKPDTPVIICTGFSERLNGNRLKDLGIQEYLMKPVNRSQLAKAIRGALDKSR
jgi:signal transduction histidine kinase/ActR/RegA family two-component response regulator